MIAFSDEAIRAIVETARYTDPRATDYLTQVLIKRRDTIAREWLTHVNPLVDFAVNTSGTLRFNNAAVAAGVADAPRAYRVRWATFDNASSTATPHGDEAPFSSMSALVPASLTRSGAEFIQAEVAAIHDEYPVWQQPVRVTFRRRGEGWQTVGLERLPERDRQSRQPTARR